MSARIAELADWACDVRPGDADLELARRSLVDTVAVTLAAVDDPVAGFTAGSDAALRWAAVGHVLDFDDVHLPSTSHVSVVCTAATLACGGGAREYLAAAGVMARLGAALGWEHYRSGWHATCTAGAPAAAVAAGLSLGLDAGRLARAMALAVPAAGGVQRAFGTAAKSLQVGFAAAAGVRAAHLAAAGASADPAALDLWFDLVGGSGEVQLAGPLVPEGLAIKLHPCCYALQRPISAARALPPVPVEEVTRLRVRTPAAALQPLIHDRPRTGLEGKFSLQYAVATALLDGFPGAASFTDAAVTRPAAQRLVGCVEVDAPAGGTGILDGDVLIVREHADGTSDEARLDVPDGHPLRPPTEEDLARKVTDCVGADRAAQVLALDWPGAAALLHRTLPPG
ncbi:MmgE/PrpD family protein [Pseudonocardia kunmingensis]|uniref:2-methylcitrate dehydratase PrpD n=1 Tax=Pseudonocardia kunmingensis TaxID=630975 RepID=A0A543DY31_9PSEU|nr:MmgE/PrpD family protein [Pseudonocardia kunmingensis]TQM14238.1 2-methylcitrate dehydratase PrpD [Pseudonocardia kunmingensis]